MKVSDIYKPVVGLFSIAVGYGAFGCGASSKALQKPNASPDTAYVNADTAYVNADTAGVNADTSGVGRVGRNIAGRDTALAGVDNGMSSGLKDSVNVNAIPPIDTVRVPGYHGVNPYVVGNLDDYLAVTGENIDERYVDELASTVGAEIGCYVVPLSISGVNKNGWYWARVHSQAHNREGHLPRNVTGIESNFNPVSIYRRCGVPEEDMISLLADYLTRNHKKGLAVQEEQIRLYNPKGAAVAARYTGDSKGLEYVLNQGFIIIFNNDKGGLNEDDELRLRVPYKHMAAMAAADYKMRHSENAQQDWSRIIRPALLDSNAYQEAVRRAAADSLFRAGYAKQLQKEQVGKNAVGKDKKEKSWWGRRKWWQRSAIIIPVGVGLGFTTQEVFGFPFGKEKVDLPKPPEVPVPTGGGIGEKGGPR